MSLEILRDKRIRSLPWRDLCSLTRGEQLRDLGIWLPWLVLSWMCAGMVHPLLALGISFVFFLTGLRLVHDAFHHTLGVARWVDELVMVGLSVLMLGSMHAVQFNHLRHHKYCMDDQDVEARSARMAGWKAILFGPIFPYLLHKHALQHGSVSMKRWVSLELILNAIWITLVFGFFDITVLKYHVVAMVIGQCLTAFFAVWTVHHDCDRSHFIARTLRGVWRTRLTFQMFYHVEHHLFPAIPTRRLPELAKRLDQVVPELRSKQVF
jgi:fatty acid desaturase